MNRGQRQSLLQQRALERALGVSVWCTAVLGGSCRYILRRQWRAASHCCSPVCLPACTVHHLPNCGIAEVKGLSQLGPFAPEPAQAVAAAAAAGDSSSAQVSPGSTDQQTAPAAAADAQASTASSSSSSSVFPSWIRGLLGDGKQPCWWMAVSAVRAASCCWGVAALSMPVHAAAVRLLCVGLISCMVSDRQPSSQFLCQQEPRVSQ